MPVLLIQLGKIVIRSESQSVVSFTPLETKSLPEPHWDSLDTQIPVSSLVTSTDTSTRWDLREAGKRILILSIWLPRVSRLSKLLRRQCNSMLHSLPCTLALLIFSFWPL